MNDIGAIALVAGLWILWCALHSLLISTPVVVWFQARLGRRFAWYRFSFVLFSTITLLPLAAHSLLLPQRLLFAWGGGWRLVQGGLLLYAAVLFVGGALVYDLRHFLGLRQIGVYRQGLVPPETPFMVQGVLRHVRHPWYSGGIALVWAAGPITSVNLAVKLILSVYLVVGAVLEERKLVAALGARYREYQQQVPMLIPGRRRG